MATYKELVAQRIALDSRIEEARQNELSTAISRVQAMIQEFGLTQDDLFGRAGRAPSAAKGKAVAAKYRNPSTGATWTGRGKAPKWIADQDRAQFAI